jgi:hypothetical protein
MPAAARLSDGVCLVQRKVVISIPPWSKFSPYITRGAVKGKGKGIWSNRRRPKQTEMIIIEWIASDPSELVPNLEVIIK